MSAAENSTENSENIVRDGLAIGARLRVAELPDVQAMHAMETTLFPADAWHIDMFLAEITHPTRTYYLLEIPAKNAVGDGPEAVTERYFTDGEDTWLAIGYCGTMVVADTADVQTIGVLPEYEGTASAGPCSSRCTREPASWGPSASCWRCVPTTRAPSASTNVTATARFTCAAATTMTGPTPLSWNVRSR